MKQQCIFEHKGMSCVGQTSKYFRTHAPIMYLDQSLFEDPKTSNKPYPRVSRVMTIPKGSSSCPRKTSLVTDSPQTCISNIMHLGQYERQNLKAVLTLWLYKVFKGWWIFKNIILLKLNPNHHHFHGLLVWLPQYLQALLQDKIFKVFPKSFLL